MSAVGWIVWALDAVSAGACVVAVWYAVRAGRSARRAAGIGAAVRRRP